MAGNSEWHCKVKRTSPVNSVKNEVEHNVHNYICCGRYPTNSAWIMYDTFQKVVAIYHVNYVWKLQTATPQMHGWILKRYHESFICFGREFYACV